MEVVVVVRLPSNAEKEAGREMNLCSITLYTLAYYLFPFLSWDFYTFLAHNTLNLLRVFTVYAVVHAVTFSLSFVWH